MSDRTWNIPSIDRPLQRSKARIRVGKEYHILRRRLLWWFRRSNWAQVRGTKRLPYEVFVHRTPLIRNLRNVDMWLQQNKITNLRIAVKCLNGTEIRPGESFSFWRSVGRPTAAKGYKKGFALEQGKVVDSIGGGLCQLTNLIFWSALHSPLTVTERWRHSFDVFPDVSRTQPFGSGATCSFNYLDLGLCNETRSTFRLDLWLDESHLNLALTSNEQPLYRYEIAEADHVIRQEFWGGYSRHNRLVRSVYSPQGELRDSGIVVENHALMMYSPMLGDETA